MWFGDGEGADMLFVGHWLDGVGLFSDNRLLCVSWASLFVERSDGTVGV